MTRDRKAEVELIESLFEDWIAAVRSGDPEQVAALYAPDAVLVPTISNRIRQTPPGITSYFDMFLLDGVDGRILEGTVRHMGDVAVHSGIYRFTISPGDSPREIDARFTFVYQRLGADWKIVAHHSSVMPE